MFLLSVIIQFMTHTRGDDSVDSIGMDVSTFQYLFITTDEVIKLIYRCNDLDDTPHSGQRVHFFTTYQEIVNYGRFFMKGIWSVR